MTTLTHINLDPEDFYDELERTEERCGVIHEALDVEDIDECEGDCFDPEAL